MKREGNSLLEDERKGRVSKEARQDCNNLNDNLATTPKGVARKPPRAYPDRSKTTQCRDIIGRRISKGTLLFPVLRAVDRQKDRTSLSFSLRHPHRS